MVFLRPKRKKASGLGSMQASGSIALPGRGVQKMKEPVPDGLRNRLLSAWLCFGSFGFGDAALGPLPSYLAPTLERVCRAGFDALGLRLTRSSRGTGSRGGARCCGGAGSCRGAGHGAGSSGGAGHGAGHGGFGQVGAALLAFLPIRVVNGPALGAFLWQADT